MDIEIEPNLFFSFHKVIANPIVYIKIVNVAIMINNVKLIPNFL